MNVPNDAVDLGLEVPPQMREISEGASAAYQRAYWRNFERAFIDPCRSQP